jgi:hypothetical protein
MDRVLSQLKKAEELAYLAVGGLTFEANQRVHSGAHYRARSFDSGCAFAEDF